MAKLKIVSLSPVALTLTLYVIVIFIYAFYFHEQEIVAESGKWGEFGDFLGGLLNPLVGLITIWLFTRSLHQNSEMLLAAKEELELARKEIARGVEVQRSTELALKEQLDISRNSKEFNTALALEKRYSEAIEAHNKERIFLENDQLTRYFRSARFLQRYVDFQFDGVVEQAVEAGIRPDVEFGRLDFNIEGCRFKLFAQVGLGFVQISQVDPVTGPSILCYWVDRGNELAEIPGYLGKIDFLMGCAKGALTEWLKIMPGERMKQLHTIPGMFETLPP